MDFSTLCVHGCSKRYDTTGSVSVPIFQSATFVHPGVGLSTGFDYSRAQNPTREYLEQTVANLEGGADAIAFSSGMAAITTLMEIFSPGDHIIATDDLYGGSHRLFSHISKKNGLTFDFVDTTDVQNIKKCIRNETRAVFIETPTNPMMHVTDIAAVSKLCRENSLLLVVDNTFLTPYFQRPLQLGADIVVHSGTKYLGGHNDTLAGFIVVSDAALAERLRFLSKTTGACLSPFDSWLLIRGIKTLAVRLERQQQTAFRIAEWLSKQDKIRKVHYPGLPSHPGYEISKKQTSGFGAMLSFETDSKETAHRILERVSIIQYAESLGGVESLITYPMLQTHADIPQQEREARGIGECLLRLSVGLEAADDLIEDLRQAIYGGKANV
ncbi:cystathionine gamma-synthase MetB [Thermoclostridium stercorarium subsp. stercorarium DSM 8532]|uniref:Cystathionine gamma-synthase MetB n=2 Tax=Thermoclostridium stercorarium TaxID=1510 RepID=L7VQI6_THES1|nr:PLP-dependent aspartate aminotransferase family protein [Thermoclostridium stercorarium]AGC68949.1 cystathionine gamma-synthase MetB [Thermoclostridium stercorarium subsp. stercorarium DSM 8532]AGI39932.1 cystathionine synthase [Thermoclostridium stercorarium subsp. stercorarium DSM 8532]ANW99252.1 cystathionine gamma-synthase [Thermoclostridium stercorarium subsp. thermolacticum DSM 2910]